MPWNYIPYILYWQRAREITAKLETRGIELTQDQAMELAHAQIGPSPRWVNEEPKLSDEGLRILDQIVADRAANPHGKWPENCSCTACSRRPTTAPEAREPNRPSETDTQIPAPLTRGTAARSRTSSPATPDRNAPDVPDEDWKEF